MIKEKYYTPTIEEFHPNFEFEYKTLGDIWEKEKYPFGTVWISADDVVGGNIRVKHLDREDIEGEGWVIIHEDERRISFHKKPNKEINFSKNDRNVTISKDVKRFDISFEGTIKNKSVLKQILKMIGV